MTACSWLLVALAGCASTELPPPRSDVPDDLPAGSPSSRDALSLSGKIYFFKGSQYWRYDPSSVRIDDGFPSRIAEGWPGWPASWASGFDAVLDWGNGRLYFFRGSDYLRYDLATGRVDDGYPLPIVDNWPGWPSGWSHVDAAFRWTSGKAYLFRGSEYIRIDVDSGVVDPDYPRPIEGNWPKLWTDGVDAVVTTPSPAKVYMFKGAQYLVYDMVVDSVDDGYPTATADGWPGVPF